MVSSVAKFLAFSFRGRTFIFLSLLFCLPFSTENLANVSFFSRILLDFSLIFLRMVLFALKESNYGLCLPA